MLMHIIVILLVLALCALARVNWRGRRGERYLAEALGNAYEDLDKLSKQFYEVCADLRQTEQGRDEQEENYEMQFLTFREMIEEKDKHIEELEAYLEQHDRECLPILNETRWQALAGQVENA